MNKNRYLDSPGPNINPTKSLICVARKKTRNKNSVVENTKRIMKKACM